MSRLKNGMSERRAAAHSGTETRTKSDARASVSRNRTLFIFKYDYKDKNFTTAKYKSEETCCDSCRLQVGIYKNKHKFFFKLKK